MSHSKNPNNEAIFTILDYSKKIKKEKGIELREYGAIGPRSNSAFDGKIHGVNLGYSINQNLGLDDAKALFFSIVDGLIDWLNKNESIGSCFAHYPVGYGDFYFRLSFDYDSKGCLHQDDVVMIAILENEIMYFFAEEDGATTQFETKKIIPNVCMTNGFSRKLRCVTEKLPERN